MKNYKGYAIVDIETTGMKPDKERITEIAIIRHDGRKVLDRFSTLINPDRKISYFIQKYTGITNEMVEDAPYFDEVAIEIQERLKDYKFIAHNVKFDFNFLQYEFRRAGLNFDPPYDCTVKLSRKLLPGHKSYSLGKLCKDLGIIINGRHRALGDAEATVKLFDILLHTVRAKN